jgi:hypothetical protein
MHAAARTARYPQMHDARSPFIFPDVCHSPPLPLPRWSAIKARTDHAAEADRPTGPSIATFASSRPRSRHGSFNMEISPECAKVNAGAYQPRCHQDGINLEADKQHVRPSSDSKRRSEYMLSMSTKVERCSRLMQGSSMASLLAPIKRKRAKTNSGHRPARRVLLSDRN